MKIAFISTIDGSPWGGSEYLWATTAEQALKDGHEVFVSLYDWSVKQPLVTKLQIQGAQLFPRPRTQLPSLLSRIIRKTSQYLTPLNLTPLKALSSKSSYQPFFDSSPDIICISQGSCFDAVYYPDLLHLLHSRSIPYVVLSHFNSDSFSLSDSFRNIAHQLYANAASILFVSHHNLMLTERQLALELPNAKVVRNPVNLAERSSVPFPSQSTAMFASVGRLETVHKGQDVLFEALSAPEWKERDWQCRLFGSGPDRAYLESLSKYFGISSRIKFLGHVSDVRSIWAENHLLVLPSRAEGTPLVMVEAMLCGRPSVVTDVGGNAEWIENGQTGFIAEAPTPRSFNAALNKAWQAQTNWEQMGIKAHEHAISRIDYSPGQSLLKLILDASKNVKNNDKNN